MVSFLKRVRGIEVGAPQKALLGADPFWASKNEAARGSFWGKTSLTVATCSRLRPSCKGLFKGATRPAKGAFWGQMGVRPNLKEVGRGKRDTLQQRFLGPFLGLNRPKMAKKRCCSRVGVWAKPHPSWPACSNAFWGPLFWPGYSNAFSRPRPRRQEVSQTPPHVAVWRLVCSRPLF